jgi:hypothetical protein
MLYHVHQVLPKAAATVVFFYLGLLPGLLVADEGTHSEAMVAARQAKLTLERSGMEFSAAGQNLNKTLNAAISRAPETQADSHYGSTSTELSILKRVVPLLLSECDELRSACQQFMKSGAVHQVQLQDSEGIFIAAANDFRNFAAAEPYKNHRDDYLLIAEIFELQAKQCEQLPPRYAPQLQAVEELVPYLDNGRRGLIRFQSALQAVIEPSSSPAFETIQIKLKNYARSYEAYRGSLRAIHSRLYPQSAPPITDRVASSRRIQLDHVAARPEALQVLQRPVAYQAPFSVNEADKIYRRTSIPTSSSAHRGQTEQVLIFRPDAGGGKYAQNGWCRAAVSDDDVTVGDIFQVSNNLGWTINVEVIDRLHNAGSSKREVWFAVISTAGPTGQVGTAVLQ